MSASSNILLAVVFILAAGLFWHHAEPAWIAITALLLGIANFVAAILKGRL